MSMEPPQEQQNPLINLQGQPKRSKKAYSAPQLVEYGSVAKLTQGNSTYGSADGASGMVMAMAKG
jgi:hypothetical protein